MTSFRFVNIILKILEIISTRENSRQNICNFEILWKVATSQHCFYIISVLITYDMLYTLVPEFLIFCRGLVIENWGIPNFHEKGGHRYRKRGTWAKISKIKDISLAYPRHAISIALSKKSRLTSGSLFLKYLIFWSAKFRWTRV